MPHSGAYHKSMIRINIDAHTRYHRASIAGHQPFTFSYTQTGFSALQKWLNESVPKVDRVYIVEPVNQFGALLIRRLRSIGCQVAENELVQKRQKSGPALWAPGLLCSGASYKKTN